MREAGTTPVPRTSFILTGTRAPIIVAFILVLSALPAQSQLPAPSRTIYKCEADGKIAYTDAPCLGAQRLDVTPTRGVNKLSGQTRTGADVAREHRQEGMARAFKPLTGMNEQQFATETRRYRLDVRSRRECRTLEAAILDNEHRERSGTRDTMDALQHEILELRQRYHKLGC